MVLEVIEHCAGYIGAQGGFRFSYAGAPMVLRVLLLGMHLLKARILPPYVAGTGAPYVSMSAHQAGCP